MHAKLCCKWAAKPSEAEEEEGGGGVAASRKFKLPDDGT